MGIWSLIILSFSVEQRYNRGLVLAQIWKEFWYHKFMISAMNYVISDKAIKEQVQWGVKKECQGCTPMVCQKSVKVPHDMMWHHNLVGSSLQ